MNPSICIEKIENGFTVNVYTPSTVANTAGVSVTTYAVDLSAVSAIVSAAFPAPVAPEVEQVATTETTTQQ